MNAKFYPQTLNGKTEAQAFKPLAMRYFTLAYFAKGQTKIYLKNETEDFLALKEGLIDLGASVTRLKSVYAITPPDDQDEFKQVDVKSSLITLRFLLPTLLAKYSRCEFTGSGKLTKRDVTVGMEVLKGVTLDSKTLPMTASEILQAGEFMIEPEISSQIVSGLIMALPMLNGDSIVRFREKPKRQLSFVIETTINAMREFGAIVTKSGEAIFIKGGQEYVAPVHELTVEGDYSTAGYFLALNLTGGKVDVQNLNQNSIQPDKDILEYLTALKEGDKIALKGKTDYIFLLTALALTKKGLSVFTGVKLKDKDIEKFNEYSAMLSRLGGQIKLEKNILTVNGSDRLVGDVMLDTFGDSRIAMSLFVLATALTEPVTILSVEAGMTEQSSFLNEYIRLGGKCNVV